MPAATTFSDQFCSFPSMMCLVFSSEKLQTCSRAGSDGHLVQVSYGRSTQTITGLHKTKVWGHEVRVLKRYAVGLDMAHLAVSRSSIVQNLIFPWGWPALKTSLPNPWYLWVWVGMKSTVSALSLSPFSCSLVLRQMSRGSLLQSHLTLWRSIYIQTSGSVSNKHLQSGLLYKTMQ